MKFKILTPIVLFMALNSCGGKSEKEVKVEKYKIDQIDKIIGVARIEPAAKISPIGAESAGKIVQIHVQEGQIVKKGTLLLTLDQSVDAAQIQQSDARLATRQQRVKSLEAKIAAIELKISLADTERLRDRRLADAQAGTQKAAFDSESIYNNLRADLTIAKADLAEAMASIGEVETERNYSQKLLDKKNIYAPADGMVLNWDVKVGQAVSIGSKLADFAPAGDLIATTEVDELYAMKVKKGQRVVINIQGTTDQLSTGTVIYCAPFLSKKSIFNDRADNLEDRRVREVRVRIDQPEAVLIGSRVECIISL
ncbi:MAG: HlyD family efflux transporter periplasmic adaptor subunit [Crocinitomicaceae bacterium]|jgi:HlyD family secretion protein|nr:HlyD family efflux transporter periplasmic adaptor subunit [Crocinitomicaceae bacterium]MDP4723756.1 HlyD family efflux transporter periplasmic adaptor subunit [Crocinitomicaceae bacterium]MDP4739902.1 HlyD family efflux transporter periplasmic adaptor subunit [Crocinitomicaceae bacterium]MDP4798919.1 HlyD family efflux transporter periplasmic adaptor subunit [Crocinitomicaceae bacterium]MDP4807302.1 HlyD family efflux transporter periplasmic adaptor subunit [Crocinitomicaceae bacterium]